VGMNGCQALKADIPEKVAPCAGMRVLEGFNDLASVKPELVDEWSLENEPLKPNNVNAASHRKVKWKGKDAVYSRGRVHHRGS